MELAGNYKNDKKKVNEWGIITKNELLDSHFLKLLIILHFKAFSSDSCNLVNLTKCLYSEKRCDKTGQEYAVI